MGLLEGKVAFITGVARGQGQRHAVRLANEGADIIGIDICGQVASVAYPMSTPEDLATTVELVEATGRRIVARQGDVRDPASIQKVLQEGLSELGRLDIVLANAGIMPMAGEEAKSPAAWHDSIDIMLSGVYYTLDATIPVLREQGQGGSIVITSSIAGLKSMLMDMDTYTPGMAGYQAAKHGVVGLMRMYARALGPEKIRVNTVHPTGTLTPMIANDAFAAWSEQHPSAVKSNANSMDIHFVEVDDISSAVVYLTSEAGRFVTGVCLPVDGGAMLV
jgi:SDR family mycofactocin-dependent oxidoreductase